MIELSNDPFSIEVCARNYVNKVRPVSLDRLAVRNHAELVHFIANCLNWADCFQCRLVQDQVNIVEWWQRPDADWTRNFAPENGRLNALEVLKIGKTIQFKLD